MLGLPASDVGAMLGAVRLTGFDGLNVTHPCKQSVIEHLDELSPDAAALGAVNTVVLAGRARRRPQHRPVRLRQQHGPRSCPTSPSTGWCCSAPGVPAPRWLHALLRLGVGRLDVVDNDRPGRTRSPFPGRTLGRVPGTVGERTEALPGLLADADGLVHATPTGMAAPRACRSRPSCSARGCGSPTSCTGRCRHALVRAARASRLPGAGRWRHGRLPGRRLTAALHRCDARPERMLRHFVELTKGPSSDADAA